MGLLGAVKERGQFDLIPADQYIFTLTDMELVESNNNFGEQIRWHWRISPIDAEDPDEDVIFGANGQPRDLWQYTKPSLVPGFRAHEWASALVGRDLEKGEEPDDNDLIGKRMIASLGHKPRRDDPKSKVERISENTARPYRRRRPAAGTQRDPGTGRPVREPAPENAKYRPSPHTYARDDDDGDADELPFDR